MADVKFHCPECNQRIGIDEAACGMGIECPICRALLMIPAAGSAPIRLVTSGRGAAVSSSTDSDSASKAVPKTDSAQRLAELDALKRRGEIYERRSTEQLEQLAALTKERNLFENEVRAKSVEAKKLKRDIDLLNGRLGEMGKELEENREQLAALTGLASDRSLASASQTNTELQSLRTTLAEVTKERDSAFQEINGLEEALQKTRDALQGARLEVERAKSEAMAASNRNELALAMERSRMEAFLTGVRELEKSIQPPLPRPLPAADGESAESDSMEEQLRRKLAAASDRLRSLKNARFALRERLAALENESNSPPGKAPADLQGESKEELRRRLDELSNEAELARKEYTQVHLEYVKTAGENAATTLVATPAATQTNHKNESENSNQESAKPAAQDTESGEKS